MSKDFNDILPRIINENALWKIKILQSWPELIGNLAAHISIHEIRDNALILKASHPAWAQECRFFAPVLQNLINSKLGIPHITTIRFIMSDTVKQQARRPVVNRPPISRHQAHPHPEQIQAALSIKDHELREALIDFFRACTPLPKEPS